MIIYSNTALAFRRDVDENKIVDYIQEQFAAKIGHRESPSERMSWRNSLRCMEAVLRNAQIADDCGVLIEYVII